MGRMSEMPGPLYKQQGGSGLLDKNAARFGEFDGSSLVASEEVKSVGSSRSVICRFEADWLIFSLRAARVKFSSSARTSTARRWRTSTLGNIAKTPAAWHLALRPTRGVHILSDFRTGLIVFLFGVLDFRTEDLRGSWI